MCCAVVAEWQTRRIQIPVLERVVWVQVPSTALIPSPVFGLCTEGDFLQLYAYNLKRKNMHKIIDKAVISAYNNNWSDMLLKGEQ